MNIVVCIKQVPDTEAKIRIDGSGLWIDEAGINFVVSPYDEYAVEEALRIKEAKGGEVVAVTAGPERASTALRSCLALGVDRAVHLVEPSLDRSDALAAAKCLASVIRTLPHDLVLLGKYAVGTDRASVGPMLAEMLGLPHVSAAVKLEMGDATLSAEREVEGARDLYECSLPAVVTADKGLNEPRYASLKGIMAAKKKPIEIRDLAAVGLTAADVAPRVVWTKLELPAARPEGRILTGDPGDAAREVVRALRDVEKLI
jgi:electron transfer flavoprotein beta subunit